MRDDAQPIESVVHSTMLHSQSNHKESSYPRRCSKVDLAKRNRARQALDDASIRLAQRGEKEGANKT